MILAGNPLPLRLASDGLITAMLPYDIAVNATHQVIVQRDSAYSVPEPVTVAAAGPAVFTQDSGAGLVTDILPDGTQFTVDADHPASAGDTLVIFCAGLGTVDPPVDAGAVTPDSPPSAATNPVTVTIGGQPADVSFAGLAPGSVGIYQVNVTVPQGIAAAPDVPVVVSVGGQDSPSATVALQ